MMQTTAATKVSQLSNKLKEQLKHASHNEAFQIKHDIELNKYLLVKIGDEPSDHLIAEEHLLIALENIKEEYNGKHENMTVLIYNQALIYYTYQRYGRVIDCLLPLFTHFQQMSNDMNVVLTKFEEFIVLKVCFLLLEALFSQQYTQSNVDFTKNTTNQVITYLNKTFRSTVVDYQPTPSTSTTLPQSASDSKNLSKHFTITESKFWLHVYRTRFYLLNSDMKSASIDFKIAVQTLNHVEHQEKNSLNSQLSSCNKISTAALLQAQMLLDSYSTSNPQTQQAIISKCLHLLNQARPQLSPAIYYNDLACVHMLENIHSGSSNTCAASFFLKKAIESHRERSTGDASAPSTADPDPRIMYNSGIQALQSQKYCLAYKFFASCTFQMYSNPYVWIRIAECCIFEHNRQEQLEKRNRRANTSVLKTTDGSGVAKVVVNRFTSTCDAQTTLRKYDLIPSSSHVKENVHGISLIQARQTSQAIEDMSLALADRCLRNAMSLLKREEVSREDVNLKNSILCNVLLKLAFVSLTLNDPYMCYSYCKQVLAIPAITKTAIIQALCYGYESLCILDRSDEALQLLSPVDLQQLIPQNGTDAAKGLSQQYFINLAIVHIAQKQYSQAQEYVNKAKAIGETTDLLMTQLYLYVIQGQQQLIAQFFEQNGYQLQS